MCRRLLVGLLIGVILLAGCAGNDVGQGAVDRPASATSSPAEPGGGDETTSSPAEPDSGDDSYSGSDTRETTDECHHDVGDSGTKRADNRSSLVTEGLVLHLNGDSGVSTDGDAVTKWEDQTGDTTLTAVGEPTYRRDALNCHNAVGFDGEDDLLNRSGGLEGLPADDDDRTMFAVVRYDGLGSGGLGYGRPYAGGNLAFQLAIDEDGLLELNAFGKPNDFLIPVNGTRHGWMTRSAVVRNDTFGHYMNGARYDAGIHEFNTRPDRFVVGAEIDYDPNVDMQVAAVLLYDRALTDEERRKVESYLQDKYLPEAAANRNVGPEASDDTATVENGSATAIDVLANDHDPDGRLDEETIVVVNRSRGYRGPMYGRVSVNETTGTVIYDHAGSCLVDFYPCRSSENDSFTYTVLDEDGQPSNVATVHITVEDTDDDGSSQRDTALSDDEDGDAAVDTVVLGVAAANYAGEPIAIGILSAVTDAFARVGV